MKKKSLLSVVGTHPDRGQVALEVNEVGPGRGGASPERLRATWSASEASQRRVTNPSAKSGAAGSQGDTGTGVQCSPTSLGSDRSPCSSTFHQLGTFLKPPSFWESKGRGGPVEGGSCNSTRTVAEGNFLSTHTVGYSPR